MRIIDPHLHTDRMKGKEVETLSIAGVEAGIIPTAHLLPWIVSAETLTRMWRNYLDFQVNHSKSLGIELRVALGVPFYGLEAEAIKECLKQLPEYLKHKNVVAIGEIGLDAGIDDEIKMFRTQLNIAKEHNLPVIVHTPTPMEPQAETVIKQIIKIILEEKYPIEKAILDHTGAKTLQIRLGSGAKVGLSLCYDKLRPEDVAEIIAENQDKSDQLLVNSEFGYAGDGYYSVPRAVLSMRRLGLSREKIEKITWDNPKKLFNLPVN
jgi:predicted metal-dependent TIM-barrel fold hydrolase